MQTSKYYCKICNCWTQGDLISIQRHDKSNRHRRSVARLQRSSEKQKLSEIRINREIERITQVAGNKCFGVSKLVEDSITRFKPYQDTAFQPEEYFHVDDIEQKSIDSDDDLSGFELGEDEIPGQYIVYEPDDIKEERGKVYLQGKWHQDLIKIGAQCEVYLDDAWKNAQIEELSYIFREIKRNDKPFFLPKTVALVSLQGIERVLDSEEVVVQDRSTFRTVMSRDIRFEVPSLLSFKGTRFSDSSALSEWKKTEPEKDGKLLSFESEGAVLSITEKSMQEKVISADVVSNEVQEEDFNNFSFDMASGLVQGRLGQIPKKRKSSTLSYDQG